METKETVTADQLTRNLLKSIRKGHKQHKQKVAEEVKKQSMYHDYNWFGGHCRDCGVSAYEAQTDECPAKTK